MKESGRIPPTMNTRLTWLERMALSVEQRFPIGHGPWSVVYLIAAAALLPSVLILSVGTGLALLAHLSEGLYTSDGHSETTVLLINLFCTALGCFFCSWWVMVLRLWRSHWQEVTYRPSCVLWLAGLVVQAELALGTIAFVAASAARQWTAVPVCIMLLTGYLYIRSRRRS